MEQQSIGTMSGYGATVPVLIANIQRLRAINTALLEALEALEALVDADVLASSSNWKDARVKARAAIEAAK